MKTLHIHIKTENLGASVAFYEALFGAAPTRLEKDYAKWLLDDPRAHISLSTHCGKPGVDHVGVSVESRDELREIAERLNGIAALTPEEAADCCYALSNKYWTADPQGARWELFQTYAHTDSYGAEPDRARLEAAAAEKPACC